MAVVRNYRGEGGQRNSSLITAPFNVPVQAQLAENEAQLADAQKVAASAHAEAQAARAALAAAQHEQRGDVAALRQQLEADMEKVSWRFRLLCSFLLCPHRTEQQQEASRSSLLRVKEQSLCCCSLRAACKARQQVPH